MHEKEDFTGRAIRKHYVNIGAPHKRNGVSSISAVGIDGYGKRRTSH
ncbi:MAG: hypothetical protein ACREBU_26835 [Nitrososphaera sp.]